MKTIKVIILSVIISPFSVLAQEWCKKSRTYCQIRKIAPKIKHEKAVKLTKIINKYAKEHNVSTQLFTAILRQESLFKLTAKNCTYTKTKEYIALDYLPYAKVPHKKDHIFGKNFRYITEATCYDFGIGQINVDTIRRYGFSLDRILYDLEYSIAVSAKVLGDFKRSHAKKEQDWWTRYNASTPSKRQTYKELVERFF